MELEKKGIIFNGVGKTIPKSERVILRITPTLGMYLPKTDLPSVEERGWQKKMFGFTWTDCNGNIKE